MAILINESLLNNPVFQRYPSNQKEWNEFMAELAKGIVVDQAKVDAVETKADNAQAEVDVVEQDVAEIQDSLGFDFDFGL